MQAEKKQTWQRQSLTLSQYVEFRNGVPLGDSKSFSNMLHRSLGAASFAEFWQYWNPIWGYGLGKYVYVPARRILPRAAAFIATFIVSGAIHDLATMVVGRSFAFLFTPWFFLLGVGAGFGDGFWETAVLATSHREFYLSCHLLTLDADSEKGAYDISTKSFFVFFRKIVERQGSL